MTVLRSILLFALAALAEIGGACWSGRASASTAAWPLFGLILAAYGGVFVAGPLRPGGRGPVPGGLAVIMYAPGAS
jgi:drug/metabolite transporter superfamily protein YnfA